MNLNYCSVAFNSLENKNKNVFRFRFVVVSLAIFTAILEWNSVVEN